jgi:hypothetical protein
MKISQARRPKEFERENSCLNRGVAELALDELLLEGAVEGNY